MRCRPREFSLKRPVGMARFFLWPDSPGVVPSASTNAEMPADWSLASVDVSL
jgi:hypothetical protein